VTAALSIVVPAYNEAGRIGASVRAIDAWARASGTPIELIVVDDGSGDGTADEAFAAGCCRVVRNPHRGKAFAVRTGVRAATAPAVLFTDADLAVPIEEATRFLRILRDGHPVVIASREGAGACRIGEPWHRHAMGRVFNAIVRALAVPGIQDTQCGFKLFDRVAALRLFESSRLYADDAAGSVRGAAVTAFDVEILFLARRFGYRIAEVPVEWRHGEDSKVRPLPDSLRNLGDVLAVRWSALRGLYP
jgi:glycosyltransferase involved in cell wall biosynthesis